MKVQFVAIFLLSLSLSGLYQNAVSAQEETSETFTLDELSIKELYSIYDRASYFYRLSDGASVAKERNLISHVGTFDEYHNLTLLNILSKKSLLGPDTFALHDTLDSLCEEQINRATQPVYTADKAPRLSKNTPAKMLEVTFKITKDELDTRHWLQKAQRIHLGNLIEKASERNQQISCDDTTLSKKKRENGLNCLQEGAKGHLFTIKKVVCIRQSDQAFTQIYQHTGVEVSYTDENGKLLATKSISSEVKDLNSAVLVAPMIEQQIDKENSEQQVDSAAYNNSRRASSSSKYHDCSKSTFGCDFYEKASPSSRSK